MSKLASNDLLNLSIPERIQLVEDLWDSIAMVPESVQLSEEQIRELDRRLDDYHQNPDAGSPWTAVLERVRNRK